MYMTHIDSGPRKTNSVIDDHNLDLTIWLPFKDATAYDGYYRPGRLKRRAGLTENRIERFVHHVIHKPNTRLTLTTSLDIFHDSIRMQRDKFNSFFLERILRLPLIRRGASLGHASLTSDLGQREPKFSSSDRPSHGAEVLPRHFGN